VPSSVQTVTDGGKGDKRRKAQITDEQLAANWERIFGDPMQQVPSDQGSDSPQVQANEARGH